MLPEPLFADARLPWEEGLKITPAEVDLPPVSIVIPIWNAGKFLEKTLRSLLCNDLTGVEIIVMDGASTDATPQILDHYADMFTLCISEKDSGQSDAINKGMARASHDILYWLNGDDIILANALVPVRRAFRDAPRDTQVVVGNAYMTQKDFTPINHFVFSPEKLTFDYLLDYARHHLVQPSVFFTRAAWDHAGPVKEEMHYAMDADLFLGMAAKFAFHYLPIDLAYSVYHEECKTREKRAESITELALVQAAHGGMDQARRTLDLLVDLYNKAQEQSLISPPVQTGKAPAPDPVLLRRIAAMEAEAARNKAALLDADIKATA